MPVSAQEWRVRTGMINASRGNPFSTRAPKASPVKHSRDHHCDLPPPTWKGYRAAMVMLSEPMLYKFYMALLTIMVYPFKNNTAAGTWPSTGDTELVLHHPVFGSHFFLTLLLFLLCASTYAAIIISMILNGSRVQDTHQCRHFGNYGTLQRVGCDRNYCIAEESHPLISLCLSLAGSAVHHLPTLALLILVLLCGDVERNPGPIELDIKTLMERLSTVKCKWHLIGICLGVEPSQLNLIEDQFPDIGRRLSETLTYWLDGNTPVPVCWESVVEALKCVDKKGLADQLHQEYCTPSSIATSVAIDETQKVKVQCLAYGKQTSFLRLSGGDDPQQKYHQAKLYADSVKMIGKFQTLLNTIMSSLEARQISVKRIITQISAFGTFEPVYQKPNRPILEHELDRLIENPDASIDDIQYVVTKYSSFFNYHIVEQIIETLGTPEDKEKLKEYEHSFLEYAERKVTECPSQTGFTDDTNQAKILVKLDDSYDQCTERHLKLFVGKLSELFQLKVGVLQLIKVESGCLELTFQVPLFVQIAIFPLTLKQKEALLQLGVLKLSSGSYSFSSSQCDGKEDGGDDDGHDKPNDDDSAFETGTVRSELTDLSEDFDPYHGLVMQEGKISNDKCNNPTLNLTLHYASITGKLNFVKALVEAQLINLLSRDQHGNTAIHYAAEGNQLDIIKYFVRVQGFSPVVFNQNGETPLHVAARRGHLKVVKYFIEEEQLDPLYQDEEIGLTALHASCLCKNVSVVQFLTQEALKYDTAQNIAQLETKHGFAPIHFAVVGGNLSTVKFIITELVNYHELNSGINSPLYLAALNGHMEIVQFLIMELKYNSSSHNSSGQTPLHAAAKAGHLSIVKYLVEEHKFDPSQQDENKWTPLHVAALQGHLNVVRFLILNKHLDPECKTSKKSTPLHLAALRGHMKIVQFLITKLNCNPASQNVSKKTPLHAAAEGGHLNIVKYLIEDQKCDPSQLDKDNYTPLFISASKGHLNVVKFLSLYKHVDSECRDSNKSTPLHLAAYNGHIETVQFLITKLQCDANSQNVFGQTPLHAASEGGCLNIVEYLIGDQKCDALQPDKDKRTPLHIAASEGHLDIVKFLVVDKCVDPNCSDSYGQTPLDLAKLENHLEIVTFLKI